MYCHSFVEIGTINPEIGSSSTILAIFSHKSNDLYSKI